MERLTLVGRICIRGTKRRFLTVCLELLRVTGRDKLTRFRGHEDAGQKKIGIDRVCHRPLGENLISPRQELCLKGATVRRPGSPHLTVGPIETRGLETTPKSEVLIQCLHVNSNSGPGAPNWGDPSRQTSLDSHSPC